MRQGGGGRLFWMAGDVDKEVLIFAVMEAYYGMEGRWEYINQSASQQRVWVPTVHEHSWCE